MQVINSPVQKIAAEAATRQSVSINPPKLYGCPVDSFWWDYIKRSIGCQFGSFPIRPRWVKPNPLSYFNP
jgi:hypothetical protein